MRSHTWLSILMLMLTLSGVAEAQSMEKVWQIGKKNQSYGDFSAMPAGGEMSGYAEKYAGGFKLKAGGKSSKGDFPGLQAGPSDAWGGFAEYPVKIMFELPDIAPGGYVLTVALAGVSPNSDATIEARIGDFSQSAAVLHGSKKEVLDFIEGFAEPRAARFYFPSRVMQKDKNIVSITVTKGSWVLYDYILFEAVTDASGASVVDFRADTPPFLAHGKSGPAHLIRASFFAAGEVKDAVVSATVNNETIRADVKEAAGETLIPILVPEQSKETTAVVKIESGDRVLAQTEVMIKPVRHFVITLMPHSHLDIGYPDLQPNIMISQKQFMDHALDVIEATENAPGAKMTWVAEASWPVRNALLGIGPVEEYGPWFKDVGLMNTTSMDFLWETVNMRHAGMSAKVRTSAAPEEDLNARRVVDGSVQGWTSQGPARGAWVELEFAEPQQLKYAALRHGRETDNPITKMRVTYTFADGTTQSVDAGALSIERERLFIAPPEKPVTKLRVDILDATDPAQPTSIMEIEAWAAMDRDAYNQRLIKAMQSGRFETTGMYMNFLTQLIPTEWLIRSMLRSNDVARLSGVPLKTALITDVPGFSFAMPDVLAGSGIKYFYPSLNPDRAYNCLDGMPYTFYWEGPAGGRVLVFRSFNTYNEGWWLGFGRDPNIVEQLLPDFLAKLTPGEYPYDMLPLRQLGDITDDGPVAENLPKIVDEWNRRWAYPRVEIGTPTQFFEKFEAAYGSKIPLLKGDWTSYWEDGEGSSAKETRMVRRLHSELLIEITFSAFRDRMDTLIPNSKYEFAQEGIYLYDEHTWGADMSIRKPDSPQTTGQWEFKEKPVRDAYSNSAHLFPEFGRFFTQKAPAPKHGGSIVAVINPNPWKMNQFITLKFNGNFSSDLNYKIFDVNTGVEISPSKAGLYPFVDLVFWGEDIPATSISYYEVVPDNVDTSKDGEEETEENPYLLENSFYRIEIDKVTGRITRIFDKTEHREMIDTTSGYAMNELLYVKGNDNENPVRFSNLEIWPGVSNEFFSEVTLWCEAPCGTPRTTLIPQIRQVIRLYNKEKRIEFESIFYKKPTTEKEGVYFAFPMNVPGGELRLEVTGGVLALEKDQLPGASRDWISIQNAAAAVSDDYSIILATPDAPLVVPEAIRTNSFQRKLTLENTTLFSYVMNNYWHTNYKASQGGDFTFRYALTSVDHRASDSEIVRFGQIAARPLIAFAVSSDENNSTGDGKDISFMSVAPDNVMLLGVKTAEDGGGMIVRLQEFDGRETTVTVWLNEALGVTSASVTDLLERELRPATVEKAEGGVVVREVIGPRGYLTLKLK